MDIIIVGAGQVGSNLANNLHQDHDVSLIDTDPLKLKELQNKIDIKTVIGSGSDPHLLAEAGASDADMIIAVSNNDEVNIVACQIAYSLYKTPTKLARLRNKSYTSYKHMFSNEHIPIDLIINPAQLVTTRLVRLVEHPGSFQVVDFARGILQMVGARISDASPLVNMKVREFRQDLPDIDIRVVALFRKGKPIRITPDLIFKENDDVYFLTNHEYVQTILYEFQPRQRRVRKIMIAGGGHIGASLAKTLEYEYSVKLIEPNINKCHQTAEYLDRTVVLSGDASDTELLESEGIDETDLFVSVTNDDESNIMASMLAKNMRAKSTIALVNRMGYARLIDDSNVIDKSVSPQRSTIGLIHTYLRKGDMVNSYSLYNGCCEAIEIVVHGDKSSSPVADRYIGDIKLPSSTRIGAIVKKNEPFVAHDDIIVKQGDHLVICTSNPKEIGQIEKVFQVSPTFL